MGSPGPGLARRKDALTSQSVSRRASWVRRCGAAGHGNAYARAVTSEAMFVAMLDEWRGLGLKGSGVADWDTAFAAIADEQAHLRADRKWRTGGRTLLHALGLHHDEVRLCAGLAWLLTPDGWHGLGSSFLSALLVDLGLPAPQDSDLASASVITEESSLDGSTRADIVIRLPRSGTSVLIEAKVWAYEQPDQCRRLAEQQP